VREKLPNPVGPSFRENRVFRGGSWSADLNSVRPAFRDFLYPGYCGDDLGFRVARSLPRAEDLSPGSPVRLCAPVD